MSMQNRKILLLSLLFGVTLQLMPVALTSNGFSPLVAYAAVDCSTLTPQTGGPQTAYQYGNDLSKLPAGVSIPTGATQYCFAAKTSVDDPSAASGLVIQFFDANGNGLGGTFQDYTFGGSTSALDAQGKVTKTTYSPSSCSWNNFTFTDCIWNPFLTGFGALLLDIGLLVLRFAGTIFDFLIQWVIVGFKGTLTSLGVLSAIQQGWTVFRDFSNIFIIGLFTFFAISMILGIKEFGEKKMIARVLIIAVLINFSFLFTELIIDASNFTAYVVYKQMAGGTNGKFDIAQAFLTPMHITSVWDTGAVTAAIAKDPNNGPVQAFLFGLAGGALLLVAGLVLLYGCFLIAARALLFIFLMLTAALAFATYLLPVFQKSSYGWSAWWRSLLNAALFGPMLMILLSISLAIMNSAGSHASASLGSLISNPEQALSGNGWVTFMVYIIGIGVLFMSFKLSSTLAGHIPGMNFATAAAVLPLGLGSQIAGFALRNAPGLGGRGSALRALRLEDEASKERMRAAQTGDYKPYLKLARKQDRAEARAGSSFNLMNTQAAKAFVTKGLGVKGFAAGADKKPPSFAASLKTRSEEAAKRAAGAGVSQEDARTHLRREKEKDEQYRRQKDVLEETRRAAGAELEAAKKTVSGRKKEADDLEKALEEARRNASTTEQDVRNKKVEYDTAFAEKRMSGPDREAAFRVEDDRINRARRNVEAIEGNLRSITAPVDEAQRKFENTEKEIKKFDATVDKEITESAKTVSQTSVEVAQNVAANLAHRRPGTLWGMIGSTDDIFAKKARGLVKKKIGAKGVKARVEAEREILKDAGEDAGGAAAAH